MSWLRLRTMLNALGDTTIQAVQWWTVSKGALESYEAFAPRLLTLNRR